VALRRGFEANVEDHSKFFQATESFGDDWRSHLIEVCAELHRLGALVPERWRKEEFIESWDEIPAMFGRGKSAWKAKVVTYIGYRRAWLMKHNKSLPKVSLKPGDATDPNS
jgi:hypothetical protein